MATNKLVSIITPCFNMEPYLKRYFDSVLAQTYNRLELVLVDDGSTDNTKEIIYSYFPLFEQKKIAVNYIYQDNSGLGAAINAGLRVFTGDYLIWPDPDDFMSERCLEKMVSFLEHNKDYGAVRCNVNRYLQLENGRLKYLGPLASRKDICRFTEDLFEVLLFGKKGSWLEPGSYMLRTGCFMIANPEKYIYPSRRGQDYQMLLPVMYISKCGYIDEALHNYVIRKNSMSKDFSVNDGIARNNEHEDILLHTLDSIAGIDKNRYKKLVMEKYHRERLKTACHYRNIKEIKRYFAVCRNNGLITGKDYVRIFIYLFYPCFLLLSLFRKTKASLRRIVK